ncbi:riboflavin synthase [Pontixanthobacter gangjinensis]|uniref:Riboflavin synthase n=1 Tax=Christiangramia aestuarii TaxID=1028746 RepID=A0A7K1LRJ6_9FLAO|nr:riboflavin synthase [Christiangramia aestuarii]MUP43413.1 riboflavin synthase [Christiangramia aestuarii]
MFTGIVEEIGKITEIKESGSNLDIKVKAKMTPELKIDQSVSHNGTCLTVVSLQDEEYMVTAVKETLEKTNLGTLKAGDPVNLERGMKLGDRLDGHIVQGHVDQTATCINIEEADGSWHFTFEYDPNIGNLTIEKGSITVNGVSLTVVNSKKTQFSVAIIPYTYEHTTFKHLKKGDVVNLEFDVIGKYVKRITELS